ncbi:hypothetical protein IGI04_013984 [Brassica rapa subsp. trilocularis]|uniref:Uncharacterized protein n=1 Tax=Brassica rapa subsp. trilocularis TaxID=1813537 RepID=A0ABQ7NAD6_BRACM|nr:hypothetical protein IGI04_013984 [Brassica rapa subsp. trilocularis]
MYNWNNIVVQAVKQSIYFKVYKPTVSEVQILRSELRKNKILAQEPQLVYLIRLELRQATGPCTQIFNTDAGYANQRQIQLSDENRGPAGRGTTEPDSNPTGQLDSPSSTGG